MSDDIERLQNAEKRLLDALDLAALIVEQIKTGDAEQARGSCSQFLEAIQESQVEMLRMAGKHEGALPYEYNAGLATTLGDTASESREPQPQD